MFTTCSHTDSATAAFDGQVADDLDLALPIGIRPALAALEVAPIGN